jgi:hypothetical protein
VTANGAAIPAIGFDASRLLRRPEGTIDLPGEIK